ncbi:MAG: hypothetical protein AUK26_06570 [Syntrophaceae bacterium CG2_30_58_14]|nr:MAG: hypothetical protein AUK26_06570 [Syntrophaceae bacterium CG2_30_58_14]
MKCLLITKLKTLTERDKYWLVCELLIIAALIVFGQVYSFDFIIYDDELYVTKNPKLLFGLTQKNILWAFTTFHAANWHPLTWLSLFLDFELYGMKPCGYHLTNVAIHLFSAILLFVAFQRMTRDTLKSALLALIFLAHPLHVESVASVAGRKDVLSGLFWVLTILSYFYYTKKPEALRYLSVMFFLAIGLMSKPTVVTLPFVLLLLDYWPLKRINSAGINNDSLGVAGDYGWKNNIPVFLRLFLEKLPLFFLSLFASLLTLHAQKGARVVISLSVIPFFDRLKNAVVSYMLYLWKAIWPVDLSYFYPYSPMKTFWQVSVAVLLLALISILVWRLRKSNPWLIVGWLWFAGTLVPMIGIVQVGAQAIADRYTYIPLIGLSIAAVWGSYDLIVKLQRGKVLITVFWCLLLSLLIIDSHYQTSYWRNSFELFDHALKIDQRNYLAHNNLGVVFNRLKRNDIAEGFFYEALRIKPNLAEAKKNVAYIMVIKGKNMEAENIYRDVLRLNPFDMTARRNLCDLLQRTKKHAEAVTCYREALLQSNEDAELHNNIAVVLDATRKRQEALSHLRQALQLRPGYEDARRNLDILERKAPLDELQPSGSEMTSPVYMKIDPTN